MKCTPLFLLALLSGCGTAKNHGPVANELKVDPAQIEAAEPPLDPPNVIEPKDNPPDGIALRLTFRPGEKLSRRIIGEISARIPGQGNVSEELSVDFDSETLSVEDGIATVRITTTTLRAGSAARAPDVIELKVDQTGRLIEAKRGLLSTAITVAFVPFPYSKVKPGSEWALETSFNEAVFGDVDYVQKFVYRGTKTLRGKRVWQVDTNAEGGDKIDIKGTYYFDASNGQLVEGTFMMNARADMQTGDGQMQQVVMRLNVKLSEKT